MPLPSANVFMKLDNTVQNILSDFIFCFEVFQGFFSQMFSSDYNIKYFMLISMKNSIR